MAITRIKLRKNNERESEEEKKKNNRTEADMPAAVSITATIIFRKNLNIKATHSRIFLKSYCPIRTNFSSSCTMTVGLYWVGGTNFCFSSTIFLLQLLVNLFFNFRRECFRFILFVSANENIVQPAVHKKTTPKMWKCDMVVVVVVVGGGKVKRCIHFSMCV